MPVSKHRRKGKTRARDNPAIHAAQMPRERDDDCPPTAKELIAVLAAVAETDFGGEYYPTPTARSIRVLTRLKEMYGENVADWTDEQADAALAELTTKNRATYTRPLARSATPAIDD
jgi:hypothetical protein